MTQATIQCWSGHYFDFLHPHQSFVLVKDIAHSLAMQCRFNGHTDRFYSVAEHSVLCSHIVPHEDALTALMHDAAEAFVGDVPKPLKRLLPDYAEIEKSVEEAIFNKLDIPFPFPPSIKEADLRMLRLEQRDAMLSTASWDVLNGVTIPDVKLHFWTPTEAKNQFLLRYAFLTGTLVENI